MEKLPLLCLAFNRPAFSKKLFDVIRESGYTEIYLSLDGPRNEQDQKSIDLIKDYAFSSFAVVHLNEIKSNLGIGLGPKTGIDWFFTKVDFGIILEDDCIPIPDFFLFVNDIKNKYNDDQRIYTINGGAFSVATHSLDESYYFSSYVNIWGWATWKRVWEKYNYKLEIKDVESLKLNYKWLSNDERNYWINHMYFKHVVTWDFQLSFLSFINNGFNITPKFNLVNNIGLMNGTHDFLVDPHKIVLAKSVYIDRKLVHPSSIFLNRALDHLVFIDSRSHRLKRLLRVLVSNNLLLVIKYFIRRWKRFL